MKRLTQRLAVTAATLAGLVFGLGIGPAPALAVIGHNYETQITGTSPSEPFGSGLAGQPSGLWGLAFDGSGNLYVPDARQEAIDVFDASNAFVPPQLKSTALQGLYSYGVAVSPSGVVYVAVPLRQTIAVFESEGANKYKLLQEAYFGGDARLAAVDNHPVEPSDPRAGDVYVLDLKSLHVVKVDAQGRLEGEGEEIPGPPGGFSLRAKGAGLAVDAANGNVYVANPNEKKVDVFDDNGTEQPLLELSGAETPQGAGAFSPNAVAIDDVNSVVYAVDEAAHVVDEFSKTGAYLGQIGGQGTPAGGLVAPVAVAVQEHAGATQSDVYVSDRGGNVVDVFGPAVARADVTTGSPAGVASTAATLNGTVNPEGIAVSECEFEYRTSEETTFTHSVPCTPAPGSGGTPVAVSANLSGLSPATTYQYRLMARNTNGSGYGADEAFTTLTAIHNVSTGPAEEVKATSATLTGLLSPDGEDAHYYFEYGTTSSYGSSSPQPPGTDAGTGGLGCVPPGGGPCAPVAASTTLGSLETDTTYHYRIVTVNSLGTTYGQDEAFTTSGPALRNESVSDVTATSAVLAAAINPNGASTSYYFQYSMSSTTGCQASPSSCTDLPAQPEPLGAGTQDLDASFTIEGLAPASTYHYRVVVLSEPAAGEPVTSYGGDRTFTTQPVGGELTLPDGRLWEMVSPAQKQGALILPLGSGLVEGLTQASVDGDAMAFLTTVPTEANPQGYSNGVSVVARRGAAGWSSKVISPPHVEGTDLSIGQGAEYRFFSDDLSGAIMQPFGSFVKLSPEATESTPYVRKVYSRGDTGGYCSSDCFTPLVSGANVPEGLRFANQEADGVCPHLLCGPQFRGATPDLSHVLLASELPLTSVPVARTLYEWAARRLSLVSVLPQDEGGSAVTGEFSPNGHEGVSSMRHGISSDGRRVVWTTVGTFEGAPLYLRDTVAGETVRLDAREGPPTGDETGKAAFMTANADVTRILFLDSERLTEDSTASPEHSDLYEYDVEAPAGHRLTDLTVSHSSEPAGVMQVLGASEDGSYVYFAARGVLAAGASPGDCEFRRNGTGGCNIYERHEGVTTLVGDLKDSDSADWSADLEMLTARVSPDGRWLAFQSDVNLAEYDTRDAVTGTPDEEVYLYNGDTHRVVCASCDPTGARPVGSLLYRGLEPKLVTADRVWGPETSLAAEIPPWTRYESGTALYHSRYLSDGGRLFFDSLDALVPQDVNGNQDVYEYEPVGIGDCTPGARNFSARSGGCARLVSSGTSAQESAFLDASETGGDVFFLTSAKLLSQDFDGALDVYDAHECVTGAPCYPVAPAVPPACDTGDQCKAGQSPQPASFGAPSSQTFSGAGNVASPITGTRVKRKSLTRAGKLMRALKQCASRHKGKRAACRRLAKKRYGAKSSRAGKGMSARTGR